MAIMAETVPPTKIGDDPSLGRPTLHPSVNKKIIRTSINVPIPSTSMAEPIDTLNHSIGTPGLGKYSPNIMAVRMDSGLPRMIALADS